jgi:hypothetical protein
MRCRENKRLAWKNSGESMVAGPHSTDCYMINNLPANALSGKELIFFAIVLLMFTKK